MIYSLNPPLLELLLLSVIRKQESYGYQISQQLKGVSDMKDSTLYPVLRRLSDNGFVEACDQQYQGRNRKYYKLTKTGEGRQEFLMREWSIHTEAIDQIINGDEIRQTGGTVQ